MKNQFDNYEKKIMEMLDREAEEIERKIREDPQVAEAEAGEEMDRRVYAGVEAYEDAVAGKNGFDTDGMARAERVDITDAIEFAGLSEEDREALRLGRELQKRRREEASRKEDERKTRRFVGGWKRIVAAVAVLVLVAGAGVKGIGGPNRVVEILGLTIGGREISKINSSSNNAKLTEENAEREAYQQIKDELGIDAVRISTIDKEMKYKYCEIDSEIRLAQLLYVFGDKNISYVISDSYTEELWSVDIEDEVWNEYPYSEGKLHAEIVEYELPDSKEKRYAAEFEYKGVYYQLIGDVRWEDFEKILKNLHFPA